MTEAFIGLGANQGDVLATLKSALELIGSQEQCQLLACSSFYRSKALTLDDEPQEDYLNAVCKIKTQLEAHQLLDSLQSIETKLGRIRHKRWGARTIDLDILIFGPQQINSDRLNVPHPQIVNRNFVMQPLLELDDNLKIPTIDSLKTSAKALGWEGLKRLTEEAQ
ncbi:2-amino-4-hydroxy-6-hydroxymethyldihydropteridine diphosphokinase [uncultured Pseudoteredinibacter sp.]|uniref:2-amino-4-hydroxy-6- hydroxymethyldihydropteridine diphosphokinase n=1 Tax=uncultured Pseudoteredinibacter sp. TaxID=1641701 RepID=UPI00262B1638|nr:2-amino-4-hydroxy-6-hydroxymethyldihydropteridine diphosphokinase [uncultured Pseudoteredinibacter sp.]